MYIITRSIDIHFAHHISGHEGSCINIHGHTWKFECDVSAPSLNEVGFVIDFRRLAEEVLKPTYNLLDHSLAIGEQVYSKGLPQFEELGRVMLATRPKELVIKETPLVKEPLLNAKNEFPGGMKLAVFPFSPTSETLAKWFFDLASLKLNDERVKVVSGRVYESLNPVQSIAEFKVSL